MSLDWLRASLESILDQLTVMAFVISIIFSGCGFQLIKISSQMNNHVMFITVVQTRVQGKVDLP